MARKIFSFGFIGSSLGCLGLALAFLVGCSTTAKGPVATASKSVTVSRSSSAHASSISDAKILEVTPLRSLESVANALRLIIAAGSSSEGEETISQDVIHNCDVAREDAAQWLPRLDRLIAEKTTFETERYVENPSSYESTRGFESCGQDCVCGAFAKVLEKVTTRAFADVAQKPQHRRSQIRLEAKASRLQPFERANCARKQSWFCRSELREFLIQESQPKGASKLD